MRATSLSESRLPAWRPEGHGTHSLRRPQASIIYKATGNLQAVQTLLGHPKHESTVRYLGVDFEDVLVLAEATEVWGEGGSSCSCWSPHPRANYAPKPGDRRLRGGGLRLTHCGPFGSLQWKTRDSVNLQAPLPPRI